MQTRCVGKGVPENVVANLLEDVMMRGIKLMLIVTGLSSDRSLRQLNLSFASSHHGRLLCDACGPNYCLTTQIVVSEFGGERIGCQLAGGLQND
jgi:hypothetical protein